MDAFYVFLEQHGVTIPDELQERDVTLADAAANEVVEEGYCAFTRRSRTWKSSSS